MRDYWKSKRGSRTLPSRADIRASDLKDHLGWVLLLDVLPDAADFRYRLIGTLVTQYWLKDSTGKTVSQAFEESGPVVQKSILSVFRKCVRDRIHCSAGGFPAVNVGRKQFRPRSRSAKVGCTPH